MSLLQYPDLSPFVAYTNAAGLYVLSSTSISGFSNVVPIQPATTTTTTNASGATTTVAGGNVSITKDDGSTVVLFNSVQDGITCLQFMYSKNMFYLQASEDIMIINVSGVKLLILTTTILNQSL